jgi:CBS domain-containing protein
MPREIADLVIRDVPLLRREQTVRDAVAQALEAQLPALPVVDDDGRFAGVFGEREFMEALFPGYVGKLKGAGFVTRSMEDVLEKRQSCASETVGQYMNSEHVEVYSEFSDVQIAEVFLHHRVLIVPVLADGRVIGVVTRRDFFRTLAERFLALDLG